MFRLAQRAVLAAGSVLENGLQKPPGIAKPLDEPVSADDFESTYCLHCMPLWVDQSLVRPLLPPGMHASQVEQSPDKVLMYFLFGEQTNVKFAAWPFRGICYQEATFAIPDLYMGKDSEKFSFWVRLFCSKNLPVWLGHQYGYPKKLEDLAESSTGYRVSRRGAGKTMLTATLGATGAAAPLSSFPVLTRNNANEDSFISFKGGEVLVSRRVSCTYSDVTPVAISLSLEDPEIPGLAGLSFEAPALSAETLGGFAVTEKARWSYPEVYRYPVHLLV